MIDHQSHLKWSVCQALNRLTAADAIDFDLQIVIALEVAAQSNRGDAIRLLVDAGAPVSGYFQGQTPLLIRAVSDEAIDATEALLDRGDDICSTKSDGLTALHVACGANLIKGTVVDDKEFAGCEMRAWLMSSRTSALDCSLLVALRSALVRMMATPHCSVQHATVLIDV